MRRLAIAALVLIGAGALVADLGPRSRVAASGGSAVVASRDTSAGSLLTRNDIDVIDLPAGSPLASVALDPDGVVGRRTRGDLGAGEMITSTRLATSDGAPPGYTTMPVTFSDPEITTFLSPGMRIDIVWSPDSLSGEPPQLVAEAVLVVSIGGAGPGRDELGSLDPVSVLLQVRDADTVNLAAAAGSGRLSVLVRGG